MMPPPCQRASGPVEAAVPGLWNLVAAVAKWAWNLAPQLVASLVDVLTVAGQTMPRQVRDAWCGGSKAGGHGIGLHLDNHTRRSILWRLGLARCLRVLPDVLPQGVYLQHLELRRLHQRLLIHWLVLWIDGRLVAYRVSEHQP